MSRCARLAFLTCTLWLSSAAGKSLLSDTLVRRSQIQDVLHQSLARSVTCNQPEPEGPIETTLCDYESVDSVHDELHSNLSELVRLPFFKYFRVDLYRECPFWSDDGSCSDIGCAVTTVDESDIPEKWRATTLSKIDENTTSDKLHRLPGCYYRDSDFCFLDDHTEGDYFDLTLVPERYTGYTGTHARGIWRAIYEENCFGPAEYSLMVANSPAPGSLPSVASEVVLGDDDNHCLEKRVYYKVISGLHASISTHLCREYLDQSTGEWGPNLQCFINRVASHPERLQYIYFNTVLLLRAVERLRPYLMAYDYCSTGNHEDDEETFQTLSKVLKIAHEVGRFDEKVLFRGENAKVLREEFKSHFRNVSRIMDCVGCDKCRLWGKVQITGLATAMKVLFEMEGKVLDPLVNSNLLQRSEIVALLNTLHRFSESLEFVNDFRRLWSGTSSEESKRLVEEAEKSAGYEAETQKFGSGELKDRFAFIVQKCRRSTAVCVELVMNVVERGANAISSALGGQTKAEL